MSLRNAKRVAAALGSDFVEIVIHKKALFLLVYHSRQSNVKDFLNVLPCTSLCEYLVFFYERQNDEIAACGNCNFIFARADGILRATLADSLKFYRDIPW